MWRRVKWRVNGRATCCSRRRSSTRPTCGSWTGRHVEWQNRAHFFGVAAEIMRRILVDVARARGRDKRGGNALQVSFSDVPDIPVSPTQDLVALDDALKTLETLDPRQSRVVELRFFGGLSLEETAEVLQVSVGTVRRDWSLAQAWLYRELTGTSRP